MNRPVYGLGISGTLFLIFLVLKLTGNIDWSWWWVTSPLWIEWVIIGIGYKILSYIVKKRNKE